MSVLSRVLAPSATHDLAGAATALLSNMDRAPALPELMRRRPVLGGPTGLGTSHLRSLHPEPVADKPEHGLFCPGALRDDRALGEQVNDDLIAWAGEVGIYRDEEERLRKANFGRLMMLTHPATDDPDRLLAAAKCVLAEWATDDHFVDEESMGADPEQLGFRLGLTHAAMDPADLPVVYALSLIHI